MKPCSAIRTLLALAMVAALPACRPDSGPSASHPAPGAGASAFEWNLGPNRPALRYDLVAEAWGNSNPDAILRPDPGESNVFSASVRVHGLLEMAGISATREHRSFAVRILEARTTIRLSSGDGNVEGLASALRRWTRVTCDPAGRVTEVSAPPDQPDAADGLIRSLLGTLQLLDSPTARGDDAVWESTEEDSHGRYLARYSLASDSTPEVLRLRKVRLRYLPPPPDPGELSGAVELIPGGTLRAGIRRATGTLDTLESEELLETRVAHRVVGTSRTHVTLTRVADGPRLTTAEREALIAEFAKHAPGRSLSAPSPARELAMHRDQLGNRTAEDLITRLSTDVAQMPSAGRTELALSLEALVRVRPEACTLLEASLSTLTDATALRVLTSALVRAGSADAQRTLAHVLRRRASDAEALTVIIPAAGTLANPTTEIEETLFHLAAHSHPTVAAMSRLALGVMSRHLRVGSRDRAERIAVWAVQGLRAAEPGDADSREARIIPWLHVLGNAGAPEHVRSVLGYCADRDTGIREAAHWALRFLDDADARNRLAASLTDDPSPAVRTSAASALGFFEPRIPGSAIEAQEHALKSESDAGVRRAVVHALARWATRFPEIAVILRDVAAHDPDPEVRGDATRRTPAGAE